MTVQFDEDKQNKRLEEFRHREEEDLAQMLSERYGIPYADLTRLSIDTDGLKLIPEDRARRANIAVFDLVGKKVRVAVQSPNKEETTTELNDLTNRGYVVEPFIASTLSLDRAWSRYQDISFSSESKAGTLDISNQEIQNFLTKVRNIEDAKKMISETVQMKKAFRISRIAEILLASAIATNSSDVHVEPEELYVRIRLRIDGVLIEVIQIDLETYKLLLSRIKLLSGMKLNIKDNAQDGRFSVKISETEYEIRSSILPGNYGESIVMRILNPNTISVKVSELGIEPKLLEVFMREINRPNKMILNTGPTGSGKTTTLYAFLKMVQTPDVKIITIEDPIEYHLPGIVQTQIDAKKDYDFAKGLKSSLRQDPDIIMVGEIRDIETAETAIHAALTGHLVFSTLHTNTASGAFTRLIDLGLNPKILTSAINMVIAQRLVRKLCPACRKKVPLTGQDEKTIKSVYESIVDKKDLTPYVPEVYEAVGCPECNMMGYKGRVAIFEAVLSDENVEKILQENPSEREVKKATESQGIMDLAQDAVIKILRGTTSIEETKRVIDLEKRQGIGDGF